MKTAAAISKSSLSGSGAARANQEIGPEGWPSGYRQWLVAWGFFIFLGLFSAATWFWQVRAHGMEATVFKSFWWHEMVWCGWACLLPMIVRVCRRLDELGLSPRVIAHVFAGLIFACMHVGILTSGARVEAWVFDTGFTWFRLLKLILTNHLPADILSYAVIVSIWHALNYYRQLKEREIKAAELQGQLRSAQLHALKMQLHPHFLFNTLNGIAALNYEDPRAANRMIAKLSDLLRLTLTEDTAQETSLKKELEFNQRYLELEQIRMGDRLSLKIETTAETLEASVPTLILQPLLENAIRHGIAPFSVPGEISIRASRNDETLCLQVSDTGPGISKTNDTPAGTGVGLTNTRARLQQFYGDAHRFDLSNATNGGLTIDITIPFRSIGGATPKTA